MAVMTIRGIDERMAKILKDRAAKEGSSINALMLKVLREFLQPGGAKKNILFDDLDHLAGTWSLQDAAEFEKNTAAFEQIDDTLWKNAE